MTLFFTRYFLRELSAWVLFIPLAFSIFFIIGAVIGEPFYFILIMIVYTCVVVFPQYNTTRKSYTTIFMLAPLPRKKLAQTDYLFLHLVSFCYFLYALIVLTLLTLLIIKELIFPSVHELCFLLGTITLLSTLNSWALLSNRTFWNNSLLLILFVPLMFSIFQISQFAKNYGCYYLIVALAFTVASYFAMLRINEGRHIR